MFFVSIYFSSIFTIYLYLFVMMFYLFPNLIISVVMYFFLLQSSLFQILSSLLS